jgi:hypothetical protein
MIKETAETSPAVTNNFNLKHVAVALVPESRPAGHAVMGLAELEGLRTSRRAIPASKHGLETVCGASCEIGAQ